MDDELFLQWQEVAYALRHYLYARYHWPADREFELKPYVEGATVRLLKPDGEENKGSAI